MAKKLQPTKESVINDFLLQEQEYKEYFFQSPQGFNESLQNQDPEDPTKNILWTTDASVELPIIMRSRGPGSEAPVTIPEQFQKTAQEHGIKNALGQKINGKWKLTNWHDYQQLVYTFANGLINLGIQPKKAVNILGFNHSAWFIGFFGSIFADVMPVGVYTTNGPDACKYIAEHSEAEMALVENKEHLDKYLKVWDQLPNLKYIVIYDDKMPDNIPENLKKQVLLWDDFMKIGKTQTESSGHKLIKDRLKDQRPGHCCTLVYTSGTTGPPKGVMLSHDNYTWTAMTYCQNAYWEIFDAMKDKPKKGISYLPLSHVAAQFGDLFISMYTGACVYFAEPTALSGSIIDTLKDIKPTMFISVPRLYEKMEETMKRMGKNNNAILRKIGDWAKSIGVEGTMAEMTNSQKPFGWDIAKSLVYNNVKKALGFDEAAVLSFGAAPMSKATREYFASLNMFLVNIYGMSETAGPETFYSPFSNKPPSLNSAGFAIPGAKFIIDRPDKDGNGEICYRGRNRFMGYYKDPVNTKKTIDAFGNLHSGDVGHLDKYGHLFITGRLKELIITAGGENVAPILIENEIKTALPEISQAVVIGEQRKYLTVLLTLKHTFSKPGYPTNDVDPLILNDLVQKGIKGKAVADLRTNPDFIKYIEEGLKIANSKAISKAQTVRKWYLLDSDFGIGTEEMTPTMKLKRSVISKRHADKIESMYVEPKL